MTITIEAEVSCDVEPLRFAVVASGTEGKPPFGGLSVRGAQSDHDQGVRESAMEVEQLRGMAGLTKATRCTAMVHPSQRYGYSL